MAFKFSSNLRKQITAFIVTLLFFPIARSISPHAVIYYENVHLAYLPVSLATAMILLFGRNVLIPLTAAYCISYLMIPFFTPSSAVAMTLSIVIPLAGCSWIVEIILGKRWRYNIGNKGIGVRLFWLGLIAPFWMKVMIVACGTLIDAPPTLERYFSLSADVYTLINIQNLIIAAVIFSVIFYYGIRMLLNWRYARTFFLFDLKSAVSNEGRLINICWFVLLALFLIVFCLPFNTVLFSGFVAPAIFVHFNYGIKRFSTRLIIMLWSFTALMLLTYSKSFLHIANNAFELTFISSVFIAFTVSIFYLSMMFKKSDWMQKVYALMALTDPMTKLPNLRALEHHVRAHPKGVLCHLHLSSLELLSRHYGLRMRIHCKQSIAAIIHSHLDSGEHVYQLPSCDLLIFLSGSESENIPRLNALRQKLKEYPLSWNNIQVELHYGLSYGEFNRDTDNLHRCIGQLSYLCEKACEEDRLLCLDEGNLVVASQVSDRVVLLQKIKNALNENNIMLHAQPIEHKNGTRYYEILARLKDNNEIITPDKFIPLIAEFNLSPRFDLLMVENVVKYIRSQNLDTEEICFSVNLMPLTLMQHRIAERIIAIFEQHQVPPSAVVFEVTEEQGFINAAAAHHCISTLRDYHFQIAIDDFGTGFANYERLKKLNADIIKIDGYFVKNITSNRVDQMIIKSICEIAGEMKLKVVAEYVETQEQRDVLITLGVEYLQGYLLGKPEPLIIT